MQTHRHWYFLCCSKRGAYSSIQHIAVVNGLKAIYPSFTSLVYMTVQLGVDAQVINRRQRTNLYLFVGVGMWSNG